MRQLSYHGCGYEAEGEMDGALITFSFSSLCSVSLAQGTLPPLLRVGIAPTWLDFPGKALTVMARGVSSRQD